MQACEWTGCPQGDCADKCIANQELTQSWTVLLDRSYGEDFYSACPLLASWIRRSLDTVRRSGRRLLDDNVRHVSLLPLSVTRISKGTSTRAYPERLQPPCHLPVIGANPDEGSWF